MGPTLQTRDWGKIFMFGLNDQEFEELKKNIENYVDEVINTMTAEEYVKLKEILKRNVQICIDDIIELQEDLEEQQSMLEYKHDFNPESKKIVKGLTIFLSTYIGGAIANSIAGNEITPILLGCLAGTLMGFSVDEVIASMVENRTIPKIFHKAEIRKLKSMISTIERDQWETEYCLDIMKRKEADNPNLLDSMVKGE